MYSFCCLFTDQVIIFKQRGLLFCLIMLLIFLFLMQKKCFLIPETFLHFLDVASRQSLVFMNNRKRIKILKKEKKFKKRKRKRKEVKKRNEKTMKLIHTWCL